MRTDGFINCCGIRILSEFGNTNVAIDRTEYTQGEVMSFLRTQIVLYSGGKDYGISMLIVTLNSEQLDKLGSVFKELGFEIVAENYHKNHGTTIYVLIKKL